MTERLLLSLSEGLRSSQVELMVKNLPAHAGDANDVGSIPGAGNGNPLQYSCLENSMDKRSLAGYSPWGRKESEMIEQLSLWGASLQYFRHLMRRTDS